ncbi:zf-HC2 domain-containing protein [Streptomyces sp. NBC_01754]|uniref:anti-sigma factor family protein n=1 Tax=Streptomyces sp. NBC_01754 TaxID=2975930 RepID=UPI002DD987D9|nr:zf-HC2 domain-containing protein [Streptomyces sp. NBC_01754]WSC94674.1 zf-HC2 domain-containing protein [Streptomyces sp. NBC_01754]
MSLTGPTPAEQHLGDRLAALVDGELKHDARERVLAHLATCSRCKAEADAQRRLKSAFATATPPPPSEGFLARLQSLPGGPGGDGQGPDGPLGGPRRSGENVFPVLHHPRGRTGSGPGSSPLDGFGYLPTAHGSTVVLPGGPSRSPFPVHEVGRETDRSPRRGRRFAFVAASAVSLAAIALGGTLPLEYEASLGAEGAGSSATPLDTDVRTDGTAAASRGGGVFASGDRPGRSAAPAPAVSVRPVLAAAPPPSLLSSTAFTGHPLAFPVLNVTVPPLIRPTDAGPLLSAGGAVAPLSAAPSATASGSPPLVDHALPLSPLR